MGRMQDVAIVRDTLAELTPEGLASLASLTGLGEPAGPESPGGVFLDEIREALIHQIEVEYGVPDPDTEADVLDVIRAVPDGKRAWEVFLDLEAYRSRHAPSRRGCTTEAARAVLERAGMDVFREMVRAYVPEWLHR